MTEGKWMQLKSCDICVWLLLLMLIVLYLVRWIEFRHLVLLLPEIMGLLLILSLHTYIINYIILIWSLAGGLNVINYSYSFKRRYLILSRSLMIMIVKHHYWTQVNFNIRYFFFTKRLNFKSFSIIFCSLIYHIWKFFCVSHWREAIFNRSR